MSEPFIGEVKLISWNYPPRGWAFCDGQLLPINQNQALFSLYGTTFGGDGRTTFALPDLRGRTPIHLGQGFTIGERGGETAHTLGQGEMPQHFHFLQGDITQAPATGGNSPGATKRLAGSQPGNLYGPANNLLPMNAAVVANAGGSQAHDNLMPYLCLNFIVALTGIFPSPN